MNIVYYARNVRDVSWALPIQQATGGVMCSEVRATLDFLRQQHPDVDSRYLHTGTKLTLGRIPGESGVHIKRKEIRLRLKQVARALRPDVIVTTSNHRHALRRDWWGALWQGFRTYPHVKQVQAFHAVDSKGVRFNPWMVDYDLLLLPGQRERDKFEEIGVLRSVRCAVIGYPKFDPVARGDLTREKALASLGLPADRPTVLYGPTYGALSSFYAWGLDICRAVPAHWNLMVKPHPNLVPAIQSDGGGLDALAAIEEYLAQRPNAAWLPVDPDLLRAMCAADLMVTDYSSAAEEYLVFDRPLVFADHLAHASGRDRAHRNQGDWEGIFACGAVVTELGAMGETVRHSLEHPDEHSAARRALRDYVFAHLDGRCAERAAEAIRQVSSEQ